MQRACRGADARWTPALDRVGRREGAATSPKNRQLPPRRKARKQCEFPRAFTCSHPANGPQPPPLRHAKGRLVPCGHAPALAVGKKAARPVRPRTRPCGTQEGGLSRPATDRLVLPGHGPACPVRSRTRTGGQPIALRARAAVRPAFFRLRRLRPWRSAPHLANF